MRSDEDAVIILFGLAFFFFFGGVLWLSQAIGADFAATLEAVVWSAVILAAGLALWYFTQPTLNILLGGAAACATLIWPYWWTVLDSIAMGAAYSPEFRSFTISTPWWNTAWVKWIVEFVFIAAIAIFGIRHLNDPYN